jgi:hypothetical protein
MAKLESNLASGKEIERRGDCPRFLGAVVAATKEVL